MKCSSLINFLASGLVLLALPAFAEGEALSSPPAALTDLEAKEFIYDDSTEAIEIAEFEEPQVGGLGIWSAQRHQLPYDLWKEVDEKGALGLIGQLPAEYKSLALRNLILRLLTVETARSDYSQAFISVRAAKLVQMGEVKLAANLYDVVPKATRSKSFEREAFLASITGDSLKANCEQIDKMQAESPDVFWQRFQLICQQKQGESDKAQLALALLQEQNEVPELFQTLLTLNSDDKESEIPELTTIEEKGWVTLLGLAPDNEAKPLETLKAPSDIAPDISLSPLNQTEPDYRKAHLSFALRRIWEKPLSIEVEERFRATISNVPVKEISPRWQEAVQEYHDAGQRLKALVSLLIPLTDSLSNYTVHDMAFLVQELRSLGMPEDAAAVTEELLQ
jgi:hypothetical protein